MASGAALLVLAVLLLNPWLVTPAPLALVDVVVAWLVFRWLLNTPVVLHRVASRERMDAQVRQSAAAEFHLEAVHATPQRTGLLIYVSALEGRVELIGDVGLEARIPRGRWAAAAREFAHDDLDHFLSGLRSVGEQLERDLPRTEGHRVDLANAPRIRR
jgi:putative membrane protein